MSEIVIEDCDHSSIMFISFSLLSSALSLFKKNLQQNYEFLENMNTVSAYSDSFSSNCVTHSSQQHTWQRQECLYFNKWKLQQMMTTLRRCEWDITDFLAAWINRQHRIFSSQYSTAVKCWNALEKALSKINFYCNLQSVIQQLKTEISALIQTMYFIRFESDFDINQLNFAAVFKNIEDITLTWHKLLSSLLTNKHAQQ